MLMRSYLSVGSALGPRVGEGSNPAAVVPLCSLRCAVTARNSASVHISRDIASKEVEYGFVCAYYSLLVVSWEGLRFTVYAFVAGLAAFCYAA